MSPAALGIELWREANANASAAEVRLAEAHRVAELNGQTVDPDLVTEVRHMRAVADQRLADAVAQMSRHRAERLAENAANSRY